MKIKKVSELNEDQKGTDIRIHKLSRYLSDLFYPKAIKNTFPIVCDGFVETENGNLKTYFRVWDEDINDYKKSPVTTILVPEYAIEK